MAPGKTFKDCGECPEMVIVPAGTFEMGSPESEIRAMIKAGAHPYLFGFEKPQHTVTIGYLLAVGKYEVTFAQWDACVAARGCSPQPKDRWGRGRHPVMLVSWNDAKEYVAWLSLKTGKGYRLLSEAEWEYVARAGTTTPFHFGPTINSNQANYAGNKPYLSDELGKYRRKTVPVGSFPANDFGLHDIYGNVAEWVEDCWHDSYEGAPADGHAWGECDERVTRGGSWSRSPRYIRSASRNSSLADSRRSTLGFRVVMSLH